MTDEIIVPNECTLIVPDRNLKQWLHRDYMHGNWTSQLPPIGHGWYIGLVIETKPITPLEQVRLMDINGQPIDYWPLIPGCAQKLFLPIRALYQSTYAWAEYGIHFYNPAKEQTWIKISAMFVEKEEEDGNKHLTQSYNQ